MVKTKVASIQTRMYLVYLNLTRKVYAIPGANGGKGLILKLHVLL
jgi:hypothetical protein